MSYEAASWEDDAGAYIGDAALVALADVESLYDESAEPGVFFAGSETTYNPAQLNAERISARLAICDDRADYVFTGDKLRDGSAIAWAGCGADDVVLVDLTANSAISGATVSVFVKLSEARDLNALRTILESLTWEEGLHVLEEEEVDASR